MTPIQWAVVILAIVLLTTIIIFITVQYTTIQVKSKTVTDDISNHVAYVNTEVNHRVEFTTDFIDAPTVTFSNVTSDIIMTSLNTDVRGLTFTTQLKMNNVSISDTFPVESGSQPVMYEVPGTSNVLAFTSVNGITPFIYVQRSIDGGLTWELDAITVLDWNSLPGSGERFDITEQFITPVVQYNDLDMTTLVVKVLVSASVLNPQNPVDYAPYVLITCTDLTGDIWNAPIVMSVSTSTTGGPSSAVVSEHNIVTMYTKNPGANPHIGSFKVFPDNRVATINSTIFNTQVSLNCAIFMYLVDTTIYAFMCNTANFDDPQVRTNVCSNGGGDAVPKWLSNANNIISPRIKLFTNPLPTQLNNVLVSFCRADNTNIPYMVSILGDDTIQIIQFNIVATSVVNSTLLQPDTSSQFIDISNPQIIINADNRILLAMNRYHDTTGSMIYGIGEIPYIKWASINEEHRTYTSSLSAGHFGDSSLFFCTLSDDVQPTGTLTNFIQLSEDLAPGKYKAKGIVKR